MKTLPHGEADYNVDPAGNSRQGKYSGTFTLKTMNRLNECTEEATRLETRQLVACTQSQLVVFFY